MNFGNKLVRKMKTKYNILFDKACLRDFQKLSPDVQNLMRIKIQDLANDPRPNGCVKLSGTSPAKYRIRCGDYRIIYAIHDHILEILIIEVGHRREIYR